MIGLMPGRSQRGDSMATLTWDANRARAVDLVQLPISICGTSCSNCSYFRPESFSPSQDIGYCANGRVRMNVHKHMCCNEWSRLDAPPASPALARRRFAKKLLSRFRLQRFAEAGDPDDCGHEESGGEFDAENTCAGDGHSKARSPKMSFMSSFKDVPSSPDHLYHATNTENLRDILESGHLRTWRPRHGTPDQREWPDGRTERRSYWISQAPHAESFVPEGGKPVLLRVRRSPSFKRESTGDFYVNKIIPTRHLQALTSDGRWIGLDRLRKHRFAKAGSADDCGHEREGDPSGGLFAPGNTCAAGGGGDSLGGQDPHPDPDDDEEWDPGDEPEDWDDGWERSHDRKMEERRQQAIQAADKEFKREQSLPPSPTVTSPRPFEPGKPIGQRIDAYRKANPELLERLVTAMPPLQEEIGLAKAEREKVMKKFNAHRAKIMYLEHIHAMPKTKEGAAQLADELSGTLAEWEAANSHVSAIRRKMSDVIDGLTGRRGGKGVRFKAIEGTGNWSGEDGRRRNDALEWLTTKTVGSGEIAIRWDIDQSNVLSRAGASTRGSQASIGVGPISDVNTYIHEIGHVLESRVAGVHKAAKEFLDHRTADYDDYPMNELMDDEEDRRYGDDEIGNEDDFSSALFGKHSGYVGKKYRADDHATEIVSMGLETLYKDPATFARKDPEYCAFVLGLLSGDLRSP